MTEPFEEISKAGKEFVDAGLKSFASLSKGAQAIAAEAGEFSKKAFEAGSGAFEKVASAQSFEQAFEIQSEYARRSYEAFVAQATRIGEMYAEMARDTYKPFEGVARAR